MNTGKGRRWAALLLCLIMMFSAVGAAGPESGADPAAGLCEHHLAHTPECGYVAPSEGSPCQHVHDDSCGYAEPVPETPCDMGCTDTDGDGVIDHMDGCAYTPATEGSPCQHVHDESCGYSEATAGSPCQFVCDVCGATPAPDASDAPADAPSQDPASSTDTPDPEATEAPEDAPLPEGDPGMDGPGLDEPDAEDELSPEDEILPIADTGSVSEVRVEVYDATANETTEITESKNIDWPYRKTLRLDIHANVSQLHSGYIQVTVAPGLSIDTYDAESNFASSTLTTDTPAEKGLTNYPAGKLKSGVLLCKINDTATTIYLPLTLHPDTLLMPKAPNSDAELSTLKPWNLTDAIKIEFLDSDEAPVSRGNIYSVNIAANIIRDSSDTSPSWAQLYTSDNNETVPDVANRPFALKTYQIVTNLHDSSLGAYYKTLTFTMPIPHVGEVYATYVDATIEGAASVTGDLDNGTHTVTFTWNDLYMEWSTLRITPRFQWPSGVSGTAVLDAAPSVSATYYTGEPVKLVTAGLAGLRSFNVSGAVDVAVRGQVRDTYNIYNSGADKTYQLGQFLVDNKGYGSTGQLVLTFDYSNSDIARVTAQHIPTPTVDGAKEISSIEWRTTGSHSGTINSPTCTGDYYTLRLEDLGSDVDPATESFTSITVHLTSGFPGKYTGYNSSAARGVGNSAVVFGVPATGTTTGTVTASLTIMNDSVAGNENSISATATVNGIFQRDHEESTQMALDPSSGNFFSSPSVDLSDSGEHTTHFSGIIHVTDYPYTSNQFVNSPVIYVRLPDTITADDWKLTSCQTDEGKTIKNETPLTIDTNYSVTNETGRGGDGYHVYVIKFVGNAGKLGCFNDMLGETRLRLEFDANIGVSTPDMSLKVRDTVFIDYNEDGDPAITDSGSLAGYQTVETYDVTGRGGTPKLSTARDKTDLTISATRVGLVFNSYAKLASEGEKAPYQNHKLPSVNYEGMETDGHIMYLTKDTDELYFQFTAENTSESDVLVDSTTLGQEDFYYYIPVPKSGDFWDPDDQHIQDEAFQLDLNLKEPVTVSGEGSDLFTVQYSTTVKPEDKNFNSREDGVIEGLYKNEGDIGGAWDQVRMIRISVKPDTASIPVGTNVTFDITYTFHLNPSELVGSAIEFGPCGQTSYTRNGQPSEGHSPTQRIRAEIQTGRIAGRVFVDADYSGSYTDGDYRIEFEDGVADTEGKYKAFYDINGNGTKDSEDTTEFEMTLYAEDKSGEVKHYAQKPIEDDAEFKNTYEIPGLRAEEYTLTIGNPSYTAGAPSEHSLRFIQLQKETESSRGDDTKLAPESTYRIGPRETTTAIIKVDADSVTDNRMRDIGLQLPHAVTFEVAYEDEYADTASSKPAPLSQDIYVWHDTTITGSRATVPTLTLDGDFQWADSGSPVWKNSDVTLDPSSTQIIENVTYTATAVRKQHSVIYNDNGATGVANMPEDMNLYVNGQSVMLSADKPTCDAVDGRNVAFIGWTEESGKPIQEKGSGAQTAEDLGCIKTVTMGAGDKTVYALWGYDEDGDGTANVLEERYTLTYDANGGSNPPTGQSNLLAGETVTLAKQGSMTPPAGKDGKKVIFVGWSENAAVEDTLYGKENTREKDTIDGYLTTFVTMGAENKTVYAVWSYDENGNNTPDYREDTNYGVVYDTNGGSTPDALTHAQDTRYLPNMTVTLWQPEDTWTKGSKEAGTQAVFVG